MRNRLNVVWQGKRTTARFPSYLWRFAMFASGKNDAALHDEIQEYFSKCTGTDPQLEKWSASELARDFLIREVDAGLLYANFTGNEQENGPLPSPEHHYREH
tara:strand:- start:6 stop:311 length:306 start_codon:yes stop_codon:yes gene_type:complete